MLKSRRKEMAIARLLHIDGIYKILAVELYGESDTRN